MKTKWLGVALVAGIAVAIVGLKGSRTASSPAATSEPASTNTSGSSVVLVAPLDEAEDPCVCGKIIRAVRAVSYAAARGSVGVAAAMLFAYGLGNGLPLMLVGTAAGELTMRLERRGFSRWTERIAGVAMLGLGFSLLWTAK